MGPVMAGPESNHEFDSGCHLVLLIVVPAKAETEENNLDSRFRGNDDLKSQSIKTFENHYKWLVMKTNLRDR